MMKTKGYSKGGKMKTKGYAKGGALKMVEKDGKKVPFYAADGKGKMAEGGEVAKEKKSTKTMNAPGKLQSKPLSQKAKEAEDRKAKAKAKKNNTSNPKAKTAVEQLMGGAGSGGMKATPSMQSAGSTRDMTSRSRKPAVTSGAPGGMGAMMKMKKGGKVKTKGYAKGGKVRGAGIAKKGVRKCKMR